MSNFHIKIKVILFFFGFFTMLEVFSQGEYKPTPIDYNFDNRNYLIISTDSLKSAFKDFAMSKALKGYEVQISSVESIYEDYDEYPDSVERIKRFIYDYYTEHDNHVQFLLLGGTVDIVPTRYCSQRYDNFMTWIPNHIASDLYYVCFGDAFDWNANGDEMYGDLFEEITNSYNPQYKSYIYSDNVNFLHSINVSRLPVKTKQEIINYTNKLIKYERDELNTSNYYSNMLFAGAHLHYDTLGISDANYWGDSISNIVISNNSEIHLDKLYDTQSSFSNKSFNASDLSDVWTNNGYNVSYIESHGSEKGWATEDSSHYNIINAQKQLSPMLSFVVTTSCHTADISHTTCLGSSFITNPNNNNIAYWGSSHEAWVWTNSNKVGTAREIAGRFFEHLMNDSIKYIGHLTNQAKDVIYENTYQYSPERFHYFSQMLLGDGEAIIYLTQPQHFEPFNIFLSGGYANMEYKYNDADYCLMVNSEDEAMSTHNVDFTHFYPDKSILSTDFLFEGPFQIGITKNGYAPWRSDMDYFANVNIQGMKMGGETIRALNINIAKEIETSNPNYSNDETVIKVGNSVSFEIGQSFTINDCFTCPVGASLTVKQLIKH